MQNRIAIKDIKAHEKVQSIFLVGNASLLQARNGPYWRLELCDATATMEGKIWSPYSQQFKDIPSSSFVDVVGNTDVYNGQLQISITHMHILTPEQAKHMDVTAFVPSSAVPPERMWRELMDLCENEFTHRPWRIFVFSVFQDEALCAAWRMAPAAKQVHQAYFGGLLEHTLAVARLVLLLAAQYPELDKEVLLAAAIFHDLGKVWELSGMHTSFLTQDNTHTNANPAPKTLLPDYTDAGRLMGHVELVLEYLYPILQKSYLAPALQQHFKHLIISHHGTREFGASCVPQTAEALMLHYADNIDAKMAQCREIFHDWEEEKIGWSPYQRTLERFMYKAHATPEEATPSEQKKSE